jgi:hypothetical protein
MLKIFKEHPFLEHLWGILAKEIKSERCFVSETDPEYDERHSLSAAFRNWLQRLSEQRRINKSTSHGRRFAMIC